MVFPILIFCLGLIIGSFLNVVIYRLPKEESIVFPGSHCPSCLTPLRPWHLIPIVSFIWQRGRCLFCHSAVSWRYPLVELVTGLIFLGLYQFFGLNIDLLTALFLVSLLIAITMTDIDHYIIPNELVFTGMVGGVVLNFLSHRLDWLELFAGFALGGGILLLIAILSRGQMGGGDIKLLAMLGIYLGWQKIFLTLFLASLMGSVIGLTLIALGLKERKDHIPFGPYLAIAGMAVFIWGTSLWSIFRF